MNTIAPFDCVSRARGGGHPHAAVEVDINHFGKRCRVVFGTAADHAGGVHHIVESWQAADQPPHRVVVAHVKCLNADACERRVHLGRHQLLFGHAAGDHACPRPLERERCCGANAGDAAGDEGHSASEIESSVHGGVACGGCRWTSANVAEVSPARALRVRCNGL